MRQKGVAVHEGVLIPKDVEGLSEILGRGGIGLCLLDAHHRVTWSNRRHAGLHGWPSQEGEYCYSRLGVAEGPCAGCIVKEVLRTGGPCRIERRVPSPEGAT